MDPKVRDYLIRAHNKVIAHCQHVLRASSLGQLERERIQRRLLVVEAELEAISGRSSSPHVQQAA